MHSILKLYKMSNTNAIIKESLLRPRFNSNGTYNYEAAIDALNTLQSNAEYLRKRRHDAPESSTHEALRSNCIDKMFGFLNRSNIHIDKLKSVIHVAGTKGKGSTCAFCESILREHGFKTGFFSSPHLINVTERIRVNGTPIGSEQFASTFWDIYAKLLCKGDDMPIYFQMLTLIAFSVFLHEDVDVAIMEVGIGGEYDTTNVISEQCHVVGITSLGLDHTSILGNTLEQIAWHKGGIMKPGCNAFTMPQCESAMAVLKERSKEIGCQLEIVHANDQLEHPSLPRDVYQLNATLAMKLAESWMSREWQKLDAGTTHYALMNCNWLGRFQIVNYLANSFYLDGAHTAESISYCAKWYKDQLARRNMKHSHRALIFNSTGDRDVDVHLQILHQCAFHRVYFVPNISTSTLFSSDNVNHNFPAIEQLVKCEKNMDTWCAAFPNDAGTKAKVMSSVDDVIEDLTKYQRYHDVLITGSLHLVGNALQVLDERMNNS